MHNTNGQIVYVLFYFIAHIYMVYRYWSVVTTCCCHQVNNTNKPLSILWFIHIIFFWQTSGLGPWHHRSSSCQQSWSDWELGWPHTACRTIVPPPEVPPWFQHKACTQHTCLVKTTQLPRDTMLRHNYKVLQNKRSKRFYNYKNFNLLLATTIHMVKITMRENLRKHWGCLTDMDTIEASLKLLWALAVKAWPYQ